MIGNGAIFSQVCVFTCSPLAMVMVGLALTHGTNSQRNRNRGIIPLILGSFISLVAVTLTTTAFSHLFELRNLDVESISQIRIGNQLISDRIRIEAIGTALKSNEFYTLNHEDLPMTPLTISLKSGKQYSFQIKNRAKRNTDDSEGIVIQLGENKEAGFAFSADLYKVFKELEITFPN